MKKLVIMVLVSLMLAACGSTNQQATPSLPPSAPNNLLPEPTVAPGTGKVEGVLLDEANAPIEGLAIYVAKISVDGVISYSPEADPYGVTDAQGRFVIFNVPPGTYAMAYWSPGPSGLISDPADISAPAKVEVRDGETTTIGPLKIKRP